MQHRVRARVAGINRGILISRAQVGSLNTVVLTDDDTQIEKIDTLPSEDRDCDPELSAQRSQAKELRAKLDAHEQLFAAAAGH
ncbi:MAG TPA: hypothetical protein VGF68_07095 [Solirubrobacteraceae bacterium]